jgi:uncharacterized HhH-GPD family protein
MAKSKGSMFITGDAAADALLNSEPLAALLGMLLDQQIPMEWAFKGPSVLKERMGGRLDATEIAELGPDRVAELFSEKPALHRFPGSMGKRAWELCQHLTEHYDGDAAKVWKGVKSGQVLYERLHALPGFGDEKAKIFLAVLAKRFGVQPAGWQEAAGKFGDDVPRSVADVSDPQSLAQVREWKKAQKAAKKDKQDRALPAK